jgi:hypothetical protein
MQRVAQLFRMNMRRRVMHRMNTSWRHHQAAHLAENDMRRTRHLRKVNKGMPSKALEAALMVLEMPGKSDQKRQELLLRILADSGRAQAAAF